MKINLNTLLIGIVLFLGTSVHAQFTRSLNYFDRNQVPFGVHVITNQTDSIESLVCEPITSNQFVLSTTHLNVLGDVVAYEKDTFSISESLIGIPFISGVFDEANTRYLFIGIYQATNTQFFVLGFDKTTKQILTHLLFGSNLKTGFVKAIRNGNELVQYGVKSTGELVRLSLDVTATSALQEEIVSAAPGLPSGFGPFNLYKDFGEVILYNNQEVSAFLGPKNVYQRSAPNNYSVHAIDASNYNNVNLDINTNGNLVVASDLSFYQLSSSFAVVSSTVNPLSTVYTTFKLIHHNSIWHVYAKTQSTQGFYHFEYDANFNRTDSTFFSNGNYRFIDLLPFNSGVLLTGNLLQNEVDYQLDGTTLGGNVAGVYLNFMKSDFNHYLEADYKAKVETTDLQAYFGLGGDLVNSDNSMRGVTSNSRSLVYNVLNTYVGVTATDTLGKNGSGFENDYLPGPYTTMGKYTNFISDHYSRPYFVTQQMIEDHIDSLQVGSASYVAPFAIRSWPGNGDVMLGQQPKLAPFVDINGNDIYEPYLGDYPSIVGTHCIFTITHQNPAVPKSAGLEMHSFTYWFDCDTSQALKNVVFNKLRFYERMVQLDTLKVASYVDCDLGYYGDDYNGSNVDLGLMYAYNGDINDEDNAGALGFGTKLPAVGMMVLKSGKASVDNVDNPSGVQTGQSINGYGFGDGIIDNEYYGLEFSKVLFGTSGVGYSDPVNSSDWMNYLSGKWQLGDTCIYGGSGFGPTSNGPVSRYVYTGTSDPQFYGTYGVPTVNYWTEFEPTGVGSMPNATGDRRFLAVGGAQEMVNTNFYEYETALIYTRDTASITADIMDPVNLLFQKAAQIKNYYNQNGLPCGYNFDPIATDLAVEETAAAELIVYPNPTKGLVKIGGLSEENTTVEILDLTGKVLKVKNVNIFDNEMDLSSYAGNTFVLRIHNGAQILVKRVIKF